MRHSQGGVKENRNKREEKKKGSNKKRASEILMPTSGKLRENCNGEKRKWILTLSRTKGQAEARRQ